MCKTLQRPPGNHNTTPSPVMWFIKNIFNFFFLKTTLCKSELDQSSGLCRFSDRKWDFSNINAVKNEVESVNEPAALRAGQTRIAFTDVCYSRAGVGPTKDLILFFFSFSFFSNYHTMW